MSWLNAKANRKHASVGQDKPLARTDELVVEAIADEVLIYDQRTDEAHCLSVTAARVWRACDGTASAEQLGDELGLDVATLGRALEELEACGLLALGMKAGVTRREVTTRMAKLGAAGATAPLIWSIVGPIPEAAATVSVAFCAAGNGIGTNGCGTACKALNCCCCCHNVPKMGVSGPSLCGTVPDNQCCYPAARCVNQGGFTYNCSDIAPCL